MRRSSYGERDYAFGQLILTLRSAIGLTQAGLSAQLGISKRAVGEWEGGSSYPKATHLKALLALAVKEQVFPVGHEEEEIRALWKATRQKVLLDETWLQELLRQSSPSLARSVGKPSEAFGQGCAVLSEALALWTVPLARNPHFTGRDDLLSALAAQLSPQEAGQPAALRRAALTQAQVIKGLGSLNHQKRARTPGALLHFA